jgi:hypothetical protein
MKLKLITKKIKNFQTASRPDCPSVQAGAEFVGELTAHAGLDLLRMLPHSRG